MSTFSIPRPSAALAVSVVALLVALGGTSYAAFTLPKNSVGVKQLRKSAVTTAKLKNGSVTKTKLNLKGLVVPSATHAIGAETAKTATSAQVATHATTAEHATSAEEATHATTADSARAVAYAHVLANGTLDTAHSKNVSVASRSDTGVYCLNVTVPVVNATATNDFAATGRFGSASAVLSGQDSAGFLKTHCPAGDNVLVGTADADSGTVADRAFWVTFN
jgi:hypothetical protein